MDRLWADASKRLRGIGCEPTESWEASAACCRNGCARVSKAVDPDAELLGQAGRRASEGTGRRVAPNSFSPNAFTSVPVIPDYHALAGREKGLEPDRFVETAPVPSMHPVQCGVPAQSGRREPNLFGRPLPDLPERPGAYSRAFLESPMVGICHSAPHVLTDAVPMSSLQEADKRGGRGEFGHMGAALSDASKSTSGSDASTVRSAAMTNNTSPDSFLRGVGYSTHQVSGAARVPSDNEPLELDTAGSAYPGSLHFTRTPISATPHNGYEDDLPSLSPPSTRSPGTPPPRFAGMLLPSHQDTYPGSKGEDKSSPANFSNLPPTALYILGSEDVEVLVGV